MTASPNQRPTAQFLFDKAFSTPRTPRSDAYKVGLLAALRYRLDGARIACPYRMGTAEADAFHAGVNEGHALARAALREEVE